jgi:hypothetical protein
MVDKQYFCLVVSQDEDGTATTVAAKYDFNFRFTALGWGKAHQDENPDLIVLVDEFRPTS